MKRHIVWIGAGLLVGALMGAVQAARATSCSIAGAGVHLELESVTVDGAAAELADGPSETTFVQSAYDPESESYLGQHALQVRTGILTETTYMDWAP